MEERAMYRYVKTFLMAIICMALIFTGATFIQAQPFGILNQPSPEEEHFGNLSAQKGRFVFGQISDSDKDKFMLDTQTGRLWRLAESGGVGIYLAPVPYQISEGKYEPLPGKESVTNQNEVRTK